MILRYEIKEYIEIELKIFLIFEEFFEWQKT